MLSAPAACTVTSVTYQPLSPSVPAVTESAAVGPVLSSLTGSSKALAVRPASFVHEPLNTCPAVSVVWNWSTLQVGGPLTNSVPEVWTVTSLVYHPFAPAVPAVTDKATAVGAVASYLKLKAMSPLELPALSVQ